MLVDEVIKTYIFSRIYYTDIQNPEVVLVYAIVQLYVAVIHNNS